MNQTLYVGDPWEIEVKATNSKTGAPVEPAELTATIYPPAARLSSPTREPIGPVTLPKTEGNTYEAVVFAAFDEAGQWLAVAVSPSPYVKALPVLASVSPIPVPSE
jgi:hypothetical protein